MSSYELQMSYSLHREQALSNSLNARLKYATLKEVALSKLNGKQGVNAAPRLPLVDLAKPLQVKALVRALAQKDEEKITGLGWKSMKT